MNVGDNLRNKRIEAGFKQSEVAEKIGVGRTTISSWETNRTEPSIGDIERLANLYHCLKTDLIGADATDYLKLTNKKEIDLVLAFRKSPQDTKKFIERMLLYAEAIGKRMRENDD